MSSNSADEQRARACWKLQPMILDGRRDHCSAKIDEHRIIIVGGVDSSGKRLSSGYIYDVRTQQSTPLRNNMPNALYGCCVVAKDGYVYVIGGDGFTRIRSYSGPVNTVYRLCLNTEKWMTMALMGTAREVFAAALKDNYIYVFGGFNRGSLSSTERYCIDTNTWEELPRISKGPRCYHCAVSSAGSDIYIVGGKGTLSVEVFDTATLTWKNETHLQDMPKERRWAAAHMLNKKNLVVIGGAGENWKATASCLIFDFSSNLWSSTPASMDMINQRRQHITAVLDGKIVVAGGKDRDYNALASVECIDINALLEYVPLHHPLPDWILDRVFDIGKFERELVPCRVFDKLKAKKRRLN